MIARFSGAFTCRRGFAGMADKDLKRLVLIIGW
jgi:hypothetical protein